MASTRIVLPIEGMSCAACARTVQDALRGAPGVAGASVNYATGKAAVDYDDAATGAVVYDNQLGIADDAFDATALSGGSIQIHS